jgi:hypothetical protein
MVALFLIAIACNSRSPGSGDAGTPTPGGGGGGSSPFIDGGGPQPDDPQYSAGSFESAVQRAGYILLGRVSSKRVDAYRVEWESGGIKWVIFFDEIILDVQEVVAGASQSGNRMTLYPVHCEAYRDGQPVSMTNSACTSRNQHNTVEAGDRVIAFSEGLGSSDLPARLHLRLRVSPANTVDLSLFAGERQDAPLAEVLARIRRAVAANTGG